MESTCRAWRNLARASTTATASLTLPYRGLNEDQLSSLELWMRHRSSSVQHLDYSEFSGLSFFLSALSAVPQLTSPVPPSPHKKQIRRLHRPHHPRNAGSFPYLPLPHLAKAAHTGTQRTPCLLLAAQVARAAPPRARFRLRHQRMVCDSLGPQHRRNDAAVAVLLLRARQGPSTVQAPSARAAYHPAPFQPLWVL